MKRIVVLLVLTYVLLIKPSFAEMNIYGDVFATGTLGVGAKIVLKKPTIDNSGREETIEITDDGLEFSDIKVTKSSKVQIWMDGLREELAKDNPDMKKVAKMLAKGILWLYKENLVEE